MKCLICGHEPCPLCKDWCDTIIEINDDEGKDFVLCCDGQCTYGEKE